MFQHAKKTLKTPSVMAALAVMGVCVSFPVVALEGIRKVVKPDGTIEYTNVGQGKSSAPAKRSAKTVSSSWHVNFSTAS